jgi:hypothetical protein
MSIFDKIKSGLDWFGKEIGKGLAYLPKVITLVEDVEGDAQQVLPQAIKVVQDAGAVAAAAAKDAGKPLTDLAALVAAVTLALANKAINLSADAGVLAAVEQLGADFNAAQWQDLLTAVDTLGSDVKALDATLLADLQKLETDAT